MRALSSLVLLTSTLVAGQRPFFAGTRPIGFPDTPNKTTTAGLDNRVGEGTTERLPLEANGDRDLVDRLSKLPIDKQPFWFINWQALEEQRKKPQTYPQRPNVFVDSIPVNTGNTDNRFSNNESFGNSNSAAQFNPGSLNASNSGSDRPNSGSGQAISGIQSNYTTPNIQTANGFSGIQSNYTTPNIQTANRFSGIQSNYTTTNIQTAHGFSGIQSNYTTLNIQTANRFSSIQSNYTTPNIQTANGFSGIQSNYPSNIQTADTFGTADSGLPNSNAGGSNSEFVTPNIPPSSFGISGDRNGGQQISNTQSQVASDHYLQHVYRRPGGYGR